ncbi:unnamed protein product, partial [Coregonus sp. 'balchen']
CEILEQQRDEANQKLPEIEEVSSQLLKEMDVVELQFQIECSCRESAEALTVKLGCIMRRSQALLPLISELPKNMATMTFNLESDQGMDPILKKLSKQNKNMNKMKR